MLLMKKANNITDAVTTCISDSTILHKKQKILMLQLRWGSQRGSQIGSIKKKSLQRQSLNR